MTMSAAPIRHAVIGTGMMGVEHIQDILALPGAVVTAVCDTNEAPRFAGRQAANEQGGVSVALFDDHHDVVASGLCDAVLSGYPHLAECDLFARYVLPHIDHGRLDFEPHPVAVS